MVSKLEEKSEKNPSNFFRLRTNGMREVLAVEDYGRRESGDLDYIVH